jgi:hypothetical protein
LLETAGTAAPQHVKAGDAGATADSRLKKPWLCRLSGWNWKFVGGCAVGYRTCRARRTVRAVPGAADGAGS